MRFFLKLTSKLTNAVLHLLTVGVPEWSETAVHYRHIVPFCTLSHSRNISSPPLQLPELRLTLQIFSSAVFGAPASQEKHFKNNYLHKPMNLQFACCQFSSFMISSRHMRQLWRNAFDIPEKPCITGCYRDVFLWKLALRWFPLQKSARFFHWISEAAEQLFITNHFIDFQNLNTFQDFISNNK